MGISNKLLQKPPLEERIDRALYHLGLQQAKLERIAADTEKIAQETFEKCVQAEAEKDSVRASLYATECAQARKVAQTLLTSKMAVEQIMIRLQTLKEFKNVVSEVGPVAKIAKSLKGKLEKVAPGVSLGLRDVNDTLESTLIEAGEVTGGEAVIPTHEADDILREAALVADQKLKEKFPVAPAASGETEKTPTLR
jgi:division protein CdvB (Snf7/Vps24/ESCRT-III family)